MSRTEALRRLLGPAGLSVDGSLRSARDGERYSVTTAAGERLTGTVVETRAGHGAGKPTAKVIDEDADVMFVFRYLSV